MGFDIGPIPRAALVGRAISDGLRVRPGERRPAIQRRLGKCP